LLSSPKVIFCLSPTGGAVTLTWHGTARAEEVVNLGPLALIPTFGAGCPKRLTTRPLKKVGAVRDAADDLQATCQNTPRWAFDL
jgi:hypothetical protein